MRTKKCIPTTECVVILKVSTLVPWRVRERAALAGVQAEPPGLWPSDAKGFKKGATIPHDSGEEF